MPASSAAPRGTRWLCALAALQLAMLTRACDIPVYQYYLEQCRAQPTVVLYIHGGAEAPADQPVNAWLEARQNANLQFARLSLRELQQSRLPEYQAAARRYGDRPLPLHVAVTSQGRELFAGRLTIEDAPALTDSPTRRKLAQMLCEGKQGALLLLGGPDAQATDEARGVALEAIDVAGKQGREVGFVEVDRAAEAERWLVRQLLTLPAPPGAEEAPLLYACFGRGHVEGPALKTAMLYVDTLALIEFMHGPCTCAIRGAGTGLDLLMEWDWDGLVGEVQPPTPDGFMTF